MCLAAEASLKHRSAENMENTKRFVLLLIWVIFLLISYINIVQDQVAISQAQTLCRLGSSAACNQMFQAQMAQTDGQFHMLVGLGVFCVALVPILITTRIFIKDRRQRRQLARQSVS
jgi:hypothetical protein